eukprot:214904-Pelagomonas_calceolata.AAC.1
MKAMHPGIICRRAAGFFHTRHACVNSHTARGRLQRSGGRAASSKTHDATESAQQEHAFLSLAQAVTYEVEVRGMEHLLHMSFTTL